MNLLFFLILCYAVSVCVPVKDGIYSGFRYLINPGHDICSIDSSTSPLIVAYVHTAPGNYKRRQMLRDTWLRRSLFDSQIRLVFMLGETGDQQLTNKIRLESALYNDIVQLDYKDDYHNLTYKGVYAMKWISEYCNTVKLVLKTDDDMMVNTFILMKHLNYLFKYILINKKRVILCARITGSEVMRDPASPWYLSREEWPADTFGTYCSGSVFMLSNDLPLLMYKQAASTRFFWIDDVFITGLLVKDLNVTIINLASLYVLEREMIRQRFERHADYSVFAHMADFSLDQRLDIWRLVVSRQMVKHPEEYLNDKSYLFDFKWSF